MKIKQEIEWVFGENPESTATKLIAIRDDGGILIQTGSFYADCDVSAPCWHFENGETVPIQRVEVLAWASMPTFDGFPTDGQKVEFAAYNVQQAILSERIHQDQKWPDHKHSVAEWLLILEKLVGDARRAWVTKSGDEAALNEVRQIVATGIVCMEQCGAPKRQALSTEPETGWCDGTRAKPSRIDPKRHCDNPISDPAMLQRVSSLEDAMRPLIAMHKRHEEIIRSGRGSGQEDAYYCFYSGHHDEWDMAVKALEAKGNT